MATTEAIAVPSPSGRPVEIIEPDQERYVRAASDVIQVWVASALFLVALLAAAILRSVISGAESDVVHLTSLVPEPLHAVLTSVVGTAGFLGPIAVAAALVFLRRWRVAWVVVAAIALANLGMWGVSKLLAFQVVLPANLGELRAISYPGTRWVAGATAVVTVINPWLPRSLRRAGVWTVTVIALTRVATADYVPYEAALAIVVGWLVGSALLAIFGSVNRRPSGEAVVAALRDAGIDPVRLEMIGRGLRGSTVYKATIGDGRERFVKVFDPNQRDTDLLVQFYRWIRLQDAADERPFSSLRRSVEHEALMSLAAAGDGVSTAPLVAVAEIEPEGMLLAFEYVHGETLAGCGAAKITDDQLWRVWEIQAKLRSRRIAHRDLRLEHVLVPRGGNPVVVDLGFGELAASAELLRSDAAELLVSMAMEVGAQRAVAAALEVIGREGLADVSPRVQPLALSRETRKQLSRHQGLLQELQREVQQAAGLDEVNYEELARIKPRTVLSIVGLVIAFYAILGSVSNVGEISDQLAHARWWWLIPLALCMVITWLGATLGVLGSVPDRLPFFPMLSAQVAASFVDTMAPASVGGMALNTRFMQKRGVEPARAVAGVGLNAVAGLVMHIVLLGVFILWAGATGGAGAADANIQPPSTLTTLVVLGVVVATVAVGWAVPATRRLARTRLVPLVRDAYRGLAQLARKPRKLFALFGGSAIVTIGFYGGLVCAVEVFGGGPTPAQIGVAYMVAFAAAIFAPTPGGLGALEALLYAAFQRLGMAAEAAFAAVIVFRLGTFFLPVVPGYITFNLLQRRGDI